MNYDANEMFRSAASIAARGMKVVKLFGVRDDGSCTCWKGKDCPSAGKHPAMGDDWPSRATDDEGEISDWFTDTNENVRWNIGVLLGAVSGIIDIEADDAAALEVMKRFGIDQIDTVSYQSSRGRHCLFQHEDGLPNAAVVKVDGLEVRLGGGGMAAQSVFPSSWHHSGVQYRWLPGRSPDDVNIAKLPEGFREAIIANSRAKGSGCIAQARAADVAGEKITAGGRHAWLLGQASKHALRIKDYTEHEKTELRHLLIALNNDRCVPPKTLDEVAKIASDQFEHYKQRRADEIALRPLEQYGLEWDYTTREYEPGTWQLTIVHSDPTQFRLTIRPRNGKPVKIMLSARDWLSAREVAVAVNDQAHGIDLHDPNAARWAEIWAGQNVREDGQWRAIRGLKAKLVSTAIHEHPQAEVNQYAYAASVLLSHLRKFDEITEDAAGNECGTPKWIQGESGPELWLKLRETWGQATRRLSKGDLAWRDCMALRERILALTGSSAFHTKTGVVDGKTHRWIVFTDRELSALERLCGDAPSTETFTV